VHDTLQWQQEKKSQAGGVMCAMRAARCPLRDPFFFLLSLLQCDVL
jgi:hypothetical protein